MADNRVKSAARALDILEFFAVVRRPAVVAEIVAALRIPQSSTSVLLRSLVAQGYLEYLAEDRRFRPTLRVAVLGSWMEHGFVAVPLAERLDALQEKIQETVLLGRRQGFHIQYIYFRAPQHIQFQLQKSLQRDRLLTITAMGRALLSTLPDAAARKIIRRNNLEAARPEHRVNEQELMTSLEEIRRTSISETNDFGGQPRGHVVATLISNGTDREPMALGIAVPLSRLEKSRQAIVIALREWNRKIKAKSQ